MLETGVLFCYSRLSSMYRYEYDNLILFVIFLLLHVCADFEIASQSIGVCIHTNFKEILRCSSGETVTRSCDRVAWLEERRFWTFQGLTFVFAVISTTFVVARKRVLNRRMLTRMQKQLANSV